MIKYQYANNQFGNLIQINSLTKESVKNSKFSCLSCGSELVPGLGKIKIHHFAHKNLISCSGETYLHLLGKKLFFEKYTNCLRLRIPFKIEISKTIKCNHFDDDLKFSCAPSTSYFEYDLTKYYTKIVMEKYENGLIPDLLLTDNKNEKKLFIEIVVTHFSDQNKIDSKNRIIEIVLKDENDLLPIKNHFLSSKNENISFINFVTNYFGSICKGECNIEHYYFLLNSQGKGILNKGALNNIHKLYKVQSAEKYDFLVVKKSDAHPSDIFKACVGFFAKENYSIKNCFICKNYKRNIYYSYNYDKNDKSVYCKKLKIQCNSNQAVDCNDFSVDKSKVESLFNEGLGFISISDFEYSLVSLNS